MLWRPSRSGGCGDGPSGSGGCCGGPQEATDAVTARPPAEVTRQLARMVRQAQAQARVPAVAVALRRADRPLWTFEVGGSGTGRALDAGTQFRIGSVTKTFTA